MTTNVKKAMIWKVPIVVSSIGLLVRKLGEQRDGTLIAGHLTEFVTGCIPNTSPVLPLY
jgi:hypothetical protein